MFYDEAKTYFKKIEIEIPAHISKMQGKKIQIKAARLLLHSHFSTMLVWKIATNDRYSERQPAEPTRRTLQTLFQLDLLAHRFVRLMCGEHGHIVATLILLQELL